MLPTSLDATSSAAPTPAAAEPRFSAAEPRFSAAEPRFWPKYVDSHRATLLDGEWSYGLHHGMMPARPELDLSSSTWTPNTTTVPSCIDPEPPGYLGPRATAVYRTTFRQTSEAARLWFGACSFYCRVWVDGKEVGEHRAGGYVPFFLDLPPSNHSARTLTVLADNRFHENTAPLHTGGDFWHYGGLMRSVVLHELPNANAVWRAHILPWADLRTVNVTVVLADQSYSGPYNCSIAFDNGTSTNVSAVASAGTFTLAGLDVPQPRRWTMTDPQLHTLTVKGAGGGGVVERFGLRSWSVDKPSARLALNGHVIKLHGWNHHTQWPDTGGAPTDAQLDADLALLKDASANFVRGAHYPQDQRWLDRMDEAGIVMWEETLGPNVSMHNMRDEAWMALQLQQLGEMLDASLNHASIMAWGWFNEGPSQHEEACPAYAACADYVRVRDPTRFGTWASNKLSEDKCLAHASLIAFNNYPAWYNHCNEPEEATAFWTEQAAWVRSHYPQTPFVISETGAEGIYEWGHNATMAPWTTGYQGEVLARAVDVALANAHISGLALWHFFDFKTDDETQACGPCAYLAGVTPPTCGYIAIDHCGDSTTVRPGGTNHKGVVDFWRRKKMSYTVVAARFNASLHGETFALRPSDPRVRVATLSQRISDNADPETQC